MPGGGSKPKYSDEQILAALTKCKGMVYLAAQEIGCEADTIFRRANKRPAVREAIKRERGRVVDTAELKLYQAIMAGEGWAIQLALKSIGKDRGYGESVEVTGGVVLEIVEEVIRVGGACEATPESNGEAARGTAGLPHQ
jgi:hypothetical protein